MPTKQDQEHQGSEGLDKRTLEELQDEARRVGISAFAMMNKSELIKALRSHKQDVK